MNTFALREADASLLAARGERAAAIAAYEAIVADIEAGQPYFNESRLRLSLAGLLHEAGDPRAVQQLTKAAAAFQQRNDFAGLTDVCLSLVGANRTATAAAVYWAKRAVAAAERTRDDVLLARALAVLGGALSHAHKADEAIAALERAVRLPGGEIHLGDLARARIAAGQVDAGMATLRQQLDAALVKGSANEVVMLQIGLADGASAVGDSQGALVLLESALARADQLTDHAVYVALMDRLGVTRLANGDAAGAANALERGIERQRQERSDPAALASLYNNLGNALATLGIDAGALRAFAEAVQLVRGVHPAIEARAHFGLANSASRLGVTEVARASYEEARGLAVRLGDRPMEAGALDSLGQMLAAGGAPAQAVDLQRRAAELHRAEKDVRGAHTDLLNLVQTLLLLGETAAARHALEEAAALAGTAEMELPWQHTLNEGCVLAHEDRWDEARGRFDQALARLETERARIQSPLDRRLWASRRVEAFEIATAAAFRARDARAAFGYLEANRGRLFDALSERRRKLPRSLAPDVVKAWQAAADRLALIRARRRERPDAAEPAHELERADRAWREIDAVVERARADEPPSIELPATWEQLAACLQPGEVAVALHAMPDCTGIACLGRARDGTTWSDCDVEPRLTLDVLSRLVVGRAEHDEDAVHPAWQDLDALPRADAERFVSDTLSQLAPLVWPAIEKVLADRADAIVLMPGRGLNVLPLHALPASDGRPAMDRWPVRYAPSLRLLAQAKRAAPLDPKRVLGQAINPSGDLAFASCEAAAVRATWKGSRGPSLHGPQAQPERVLPLFETTDVLHWAGHGSFDGTDPLASRLVCAPGREGDAITVRALLESVPVARTRVVLLSACETGRVEAGDPLNDQLGLPGALLVAGSSAILATFWMVDDLAAALVLSRCVERWEAGEVDLERALAEALAWLRGEATGSVILAWIRAQMERQEQQDPQLELAYDRIARRGDDDRPFAQPLYWAAFHVTGSGVRSEPSLAAASASAR